MEEIAYCAARWLQAPTCRQQGPLPPLPLQWIYSSVSKASLQKTGVLLNSAGELSGVFAEKIQNGANGDFQQLEKPAIGGPFCH
jgi:hypothetical protein